MKERRGHFIAYEPANFRRSSLLLLEQCNKLITEYEEAGYSLSVRQLYYQLVTENIIPNESEQYEKIQGLLAKGRMAGLVSWTAIEDRGRALFGNTYHPSPSHAIMEQARTYKLDKWADQDFYPVVRCEKQALEDVVGQICGKLDVDYVSCKGYSSVSEQWRMARRFRSCIAKGQQPIVFYLGDYDASGWDMTRNEAEKLSLFTGTPVMVQRIGLLRHQIEEWDLVPNPAKESDSRYEQYVLEHGTTSSWELDAAKPQYIQNMIEEAVSKIRDEARWSAILATEIADRQVLEEMAELAGGKMKLEEDEDDAD